MVPAVEVIVARARSLGYRPALAKALRLRGFAAIAADVRVDAIAPLAEATTLAFTAGDDELAVEAFARRAWAEGTSRELEPERALDGVQLVEAIASRLPAGARATRALLANNVGGVELAVGRRDRARAAFERALAERSEVTGPAAIELAQVPANLALAIDDAARRDRLFAETIANLTAAVGANHPVTLDARIVAATHTDDRRAAEAGLVSACSELATLHRDRGETIAECAFELSWLALDRGDDAAARRWFTEVAGAAASGGAEQDAELARAHLARLDGNPRGAERAFAATRAALGDLDRQPWWRRRFAIEADIGRGLAARDAGDRGSALAMFERARTELDNLLIDHPSPARARRLERVHRELAAAR